MNSDILAAAIIFDLPLSDNYTEADLQANMEFVTELARRAADLLRDDESTQQLLAARGIGIFDEVFVQSL